MVWEGGGGVWGSFGGGVGRCWEVLEKVLEGVGRCWKRCWKVLGRHWEGAAWAPYLCIMPVHRQYANWARCGAGRCSLDRERRSNTVQGSGGRAKPGTVHAHAARMWRPSGLPKPEQAVSERQGATPRHRGTTSDHQLGLAPRRLLGQCICSKLRNERGAGSSGANGVGSPWGAAHPARGGVERHWLRARH